MREMKNFLTKINGHFCSLNDLKMLFERAKDYEKTSFKGLFNFIRFIEKLKTGNSDMSSAKVIGENENVVRIMSIHKSKGLEYGYVILPFTDIPIDRLKKTGMDVIIKNNEQIGYNFNYGDKKSVQNDYFDESEEKQEKLKKQDNY